MACQPESLGSILWLLGTCWCC